MSGIHQDVVISMSEVVKQGLTLDLGAVVLNLLISADPGPNILNGPYGPLNHQTDLKCAI